MSEYRIVEFKARGGGWIALQPSSVEALIELEIGGCQIVTKSDVYVVQLDYLEVRECIWPDSTPRARSAKGPA